MEQSLSKACQTRLEYSSCINIMTREGVPISHATIVNEARRHALETRKGIKKPLLTDAQKAKRLACCRSTLNTNWKKYLFTDEAPFWQTGAVHAYYSRPGTTPRIIPSVKHPAKINVWGGVSYYGKTDLKVMGSNETMTSECYRGVIQQYVIDNAEQHFGNCAYVFLYDDAPAHRARATQSWLEENDVSE